MLLLASFYSHAQTEADDIIKLKNAYPPSPNATAFAKYGEWPVSLYTGVPNISIPLTSVKGRDIEIPISISYHASGNKVGDIASWVGLGWNLNAGGMISRSVRGLNDEEGYFSYSSNYSDPDDLSSQAPENIKKQRAVQTAKNLVDSEQDVYSFSAMGKSFKLIVLADGSVQTIPYSKIKFESNPIVGSATARSNNSWTVVMEDGTTLVFGAGEEFLERTSIRGFSTGDGRNLQYVSSWLLKSITTTKSDVVTFSYQPYTIEQDSYFSQFDFIKFKKSIYPGFEQNTGCAYVEHSVNTKSSLSIQDVNVKLLSSINTDMCRVEFIPGQEARQDIKGTVPSLSEIKVYSKLNEKYIERYKLITSYNIAASGTEFKQGSDNYHKKRLRLDRIERADIENISLPQVWSFVYNPTKLPSRRSFAQDHWGYYNGATSNSTLLPREYFQLPAYSFLVQYRSITGFMPDKHDLGGDRETSEQFVQAEILNKVYYPTGGYSRFTYEPNSIQTTKEIYEDFSKELSLNINKDNPAPASVSATFTITKPSYIKLVLESIISNSILRDQPKAKVSVSVKDGNNDEVIGVSADGVRWYNLVTSGTYTVTLKSNVPSSSYLTQNDYVTARAAFTYPQSKGTMSVKEYTGGLRIKSILDFDGFSSTNEKFYEYSDPLVINPIDYANDYLTTQESSTHDPLTGENCYFVTTTRSTSSKYSGGTVQGGTTGYGKVKTIYGSANENGYTISYFNNQEDLSEFQDPHLFPFPPATSMDHRRGLLKIEEVYDKDGNKLKVTENYYSFSIVKKIASLKAGYLEKQDPFFCTDPLQFCGIGLAYYSTEIEKVLLDSTRVTEAKAGNNITSLTEFYYDNPSSLYPTRTIKPDGKGGKETVFVRTALDKDQIISNTTLTPTEIAAIDQLFAKNMINQVVQKDVYNANLRIFRETVYYKTFDNGMVLPINIVVQNSDATPYSRLRITNYDAVGNVLKYSTVDGVVKQFLWDCKSTYPIAEITNSDLNDFAYTSFECEGNGNFKDVVSGVMDLASITGMRVGNYNSGTVLQKDQLNTAKKYTLSFFNKGGSLSLATTGGSVILKQTTPYGNGWQFMVYEISGATAVSVSATSAGIIDEVRLVPSGSQLTAYTVTPLIGTGSKTDVSGVIQLFEYDEFNRLKLVKDHNRDIIKAYNYNYQQR